MKQIKDIKKKLEWEDYYNPEFSWNNPPLYYNNKLSEEFIREFKNKVNWTYISRFQTLSEDFIREFKDRVNWTYISCSQKLSENFIREFKNNVDWFWISVYQTKTLSEDFKEEFKKELDIL